MSAGIDAFGILYGVRNGDTIRLMATRGRIGLEALGIFASRIRGKIFLTEEDLERFEKAGACVALVVSGGLGGFFVRDAAGAIETVQSYEEFSIYARQAAPILKKRRVHWAFSLALLPLVFLFYKPHQEQLALKVLESGGQLRISWNVPSTQVLTILDGGERTYISVNRDESTATYARRSGDVLIGMGTAQTRFLGSPPPASAMDQARAGLIALRKKVAHLRALRAVHRAKISQLERRLQ